MNERMSREGGDREEVSRGRETGGVTEEESSLFNSLILSENKDKWS